MNSPQSMAATVVDICERVEAGTLNPLIAVLALLALGIEDSYVQACIERIVPDNEVIAKPS